MPVTVRLGPASERTLNALAKRHRLSRSEVVREALDRFDALDRSPQHANRPYQAWLDVIGVVNLGARASQQTTGEQFTAVLRGESRARRAR